MTADTTTTTRGPHTTERRIAAATVLAPVAAGVGVEEGCDHAG